MKKILITGSNGFIGKNLVWTLESYDYEILKFERGDSLEKLTKLVIECDFVIHLAGVNRPENPGEDYSDNTGLTESLVKILRNNNKIVPVIFTSSIHVEKDSDYGRSKKQAENVLLEYHKEKENVFVLRLSNIYGKWCRPNYNSVIATWCHNISRNLDISITDETVEIPFVYIDDVTKYITNILEGQLKKKSKGIYEVKPIDSVSLREVKDLLLSFRESRKNLSLPNQKTRFSKNLYSTYLSYIPVDEMLYPLKMNVDSRGSFTEFLKDDIFGQISVNVSKHGITKGEHWHHSKNERFLVVFGQGSIQIRNIITDETHTYNVLGEKLEVIDIPPGYAHKITNTGDSDLVTIMWANEVFDPNNPDTYHFKV